MSNPAKAIHIVEYDEDKTVCRYVFESIESARAFRDKVLIGKVVRITTASLYGMDFVNKLTGEHTEPA